MAMENLIRRTIGDSISLHTDFDPTLMKVRVDPGQIENVIMNIVSNAKDAMPLGGRLLFRSANMEVRDQRMSALDYNDDVGPIDSLNPGSYAMLSIEDTGTGMDAETMGRIFEPFFTTKLMGKGSGMGLAIVYGIVKQSGGHVLVDSAVGAGSRFRICLPGYPVGNP
jgi:two-component system cell cycle sensor histidine kinase/response regulator CckA